MGAVGDAAVQPPRARRGPGGARARHARGGTRPASAPACALTFHPGGCRPVRSSVRYSVMSRSRVLFSAAALLSLASLVRRLRIELRRPRPRKPSPGARIQSPCPPSPSRAGRSTAICGSPARSWPTNRPRSAPRSPGRVTARRSSAARASRPARCWSGCRPTRPRRSSRRPKPTPAQIEARLGLAAGQPFDPKRSRKC